VHENILQAISQAISQAIAHAAKQSTAKTSTRASQYHRYLTDKKGKSTHTGESSRQNIANHVGNKLTHDIARR
jgi:hypothetical protein